jgi:hypothetical protein
MTIPSFLSSQEPGRKQILSAIHNIILKLDKNAKSEISSMMGKEMIIYKTSGIFKYGLSSVKDHMTLHVMPIYGSSKLHSKYEKLLDKTKFQKGCINFKKAEEMPIDIVTQLINDCSKLDLQAILKEMKTNSGRK